MPAGPLRHRVSIVAPVEQRSGGSGEVTVLSNALGTRWAEIMPATGREAIFANQTQAQGTHQVTIRYYAGLTTRHWLNYKGRVLQIQAIVNLEEQNVWQVLLCKETPRNSA